MSDAVQEAIAAMRRGEEDVILGGKSIGDEGAQAIAAELKKNETKITYLDLDDNGIGDEGCGALASALQSPHSKLTLLDLYSNNIGAEGCGALASALQSPHSKLTVLGLASNSIGAEGCGALASALQSPHSKLTELYLYNNNIGAEGCGALASALQSEHSKLSVLTLGYNSIGCEGCGALASALRSPHSKLTVLYLAGNSIGDEGCGALASALQSEHSKLTKLDLGGNSIGAEGCGALASALRSPHSQLTALHLRGNNIGDGGASLLASALEKNTSLRHLNGLSSISTPVKARVLALLHLSRDGVTDVPRDLVAKLPDELLTQVSFADFKPILSSLRELAKATPPPQPPPARTVPSQPPAPRRPAARFTPAPAPPRTEMPQDPAQLLAKDIPKEKLLAWSEVDAIVQNRDVLGTGGTGEMFRGELRGEAVAVKVGARSGVNNRLVLDFKREVRALCNITVHPNIMPLKYIVAEQRGIALVFPLAESLDDACYEAQENNDNEGGGAHVPREILLYLYDIACGLRHIHAHGLEHRDLKPANTFLLRNTQSVDGRSARAVISDFGTAKLHVLKTTLALSTSKGQGGTVGTLPYMSPEQAARKSIRKYQVSAKSDIWSYGHLVNELVTGNSPYVDEETDVTVLVQSEVTRGDFLPKADDSLPEALQRLVNRCFRFNPFQRPSAHEICLRLEEILNEQEQSKESVFAVFDKEDERMHSMFSQFAQKLGLNERLGNIEELLRVANDRGGTIAQGVQQLAEANQIIQQQQEQLSYVTETTKAAFCGRMQAAEARLNYVQGTLNQ